MTGHRLPVFKSEHVEDILSNEQLWAPWRLSYIVRDPDEKAREVERAAALTLRPGGERSCFLCRTVVDTRDRENLVVCRLEHVFVILNRYPYNNGHVLVAPLDHRARLDDCPPEVHAEAVSVLARLVTVMERDMNAQGFNIGLNLGGIAGAGVPGHLHWHLVPRWSGDTNFMPVLTQTNVISQSLDALYDLLSASAEQLRGVSA